MKEVPEKNKNTDRARLCSVLAWHRHLINILANGQLNGASPLRRLICHLPS